MNIIEKDKNSNNETVDRDYDIYESIVYIIENMNYVLNVIKQILVKIGAKNVIPKNFKKTLVIGLMEIRVLISLFKKHN